MGAAAGFLEYTGQGSTTLERAMDRDERLMAILGARLLETQKRVGETSEAIELRKTRASWRRKSEIRRMGLRITRRGQT